MPSPSPTCAPIHNVPCLRLRRDLHVGILGAMTTPEKIGRYEIKGELGRGGMATVYRAYDPSFEREVAIKVLPRELLHDPQFRDRFRREIKTIASLEHPAIVPVYDVGEEDGIPYFVMRYMPGGSLTQWIEKGKFSLEDAARIIERLSGALRVRAQERPHPSRPQAGQHTV